MEVGDRRDSRVVAARADQTVMFRCVQNADKFIDCPRAQLGVAVEQQDIVGARIEFRDRTIARPDDAQRDVISYVPNVRYVCDALQDVFLESGRILSCVVHKNHCVTSRIDMFKNRPDARAHLCPLADHARNHSD